MMQSNNTIWLEMGRHGTLFCCSVLDH